jgi:hypothetical protein
LRLDLPALLRAPDFEDLRDEVEERFAAERDFEAPLFFAPLERFDPPAFEPRAEERELFEPELFVERFDDEPFEAPFDPLFVPPRADERELFDALLRAVDFLAPPLLALPELLLAPLLDLFAALFFDPDPLRLPPPSCLLTVAQARRSASSSDTPRLS